MIVTFLPLDTLLQQNISKGGETQIWKRPAFKINVDFLSLTSFSLDLLKHLFYTLQYTL